MEQQWMSVAQAAVRLGVSERRIRQLMTSGELNAEEIAGRQLPSADAVRRRGIVRPPTGRPLSAEMAWAVLAALNAVPERGTHQALLAAAPDRKLHWRLVRLLQGERKPAEWAALLRRRAIAQRFYAHPGVLTELLADQRLSPGRAAAAAAAGLDVGGGDDAVAYVRSADLAAVIAEYGLEADAHGNVELRSYEAEAARVLIPGQPAPAGVAAADLLDSPDARLCAAGSAWWQRATDLLREAVTADR